LQGIGRAEDGTSDPTGVFWPSPTLPGGDPNPLWQLVGRFGSGSSPFNLYSGFRSSDHKAVWVDLQITPVPEPSTIVLFAGGLGLLGASALRRRR
jgi:3-phytase/alkaline phosphatase D